MVKRELLAMKIEEGYMPFRGYQTYYRIVGEKNPNLAPLLLLHGGPGSSHNYFELLDDYADTGRQLIMYDQVGCGKSSIPDDESMYVKETWAEELIELRKFLHLDEVHLLGQSWGGMLEMFYLTHYDHLGIKSVMIDGSPASIKLWIQEQHRLISYLSYEDRTAIAEAERTGDFTNPKYLAANDRYMERYCWDDPDENSPEPLRRPTNGKKASLIAEGPNEFTENGTLGDFDVTDELHKIDVPTLVTNGTDDLCTPLIAKSVYDHIPGAKWHLFANSRHLALLDQHDEFIHVLDQWLKQND
jgi:proline iminopeptidase